MRLETRALVVAIRPHGEHGAIVRALTPSSGLLAGYVRGGRSRRLRPVLVPGNLVQAEFRARTEDQLPQLSLELVHSRAFLLSEPLPSAAMDWACALTAATLPEGQAYPFLFEAMEGLLQALEAAPSARFWAVALLRYELLLLAELGFGLEEARLAAILPPGPEAPWEAVHRALGESGDRLSRDLLAGRGGQVLASRERLVERLKRVAH